MQEQVTLLALGTIFGGIVTYLLKFVGPKAKLVLWFHHSFAYQITSQNATIHTQTYAIQNIGRERAENIEIVHKRKPDYFKLNPSLNYTESFTPSGEHVIHIPSMARKEIVALEILTYTAQPPEFQYVRYKDGYANAVVPSMRPTPSKWRLLLLQVLIFLGSGVAGYAAFRGVVKLLEIATQSLSAS